MHYQEYLPHPFLKKFIKCYWVLEISESTPSAEGLEVLAEGVEISFTLAERIEFETSEGTIGTATDCIVSGPMIRPLQLRPRRYLKAFGVCFRAGGAYPFFSYPANKLANGFVEIEALSGSRHSELIQQVQADCKTTQERIALLDRYFLKHLDLKRRENLSLTAAVDIIEASQGQVDIDYLAGQVNLSIRQLERDFKERIGLSPKQLCRSLRFKNIFKHLSTTPADSWASTAVACGYYDQSHLIKDFKYYTGSSPAIYFEKSEKKEGLFVGMINNKDWNSG